MPTKGRFTAGSMRIICSIVRSCCRVCRPWATPAARRRCGPTSIRYVHAMWGRAPVIRYETKPGEQMQYDWAEFHYEQQGKERKFYGFTAVLGYSRMRFVTFVKRCDTATMLRCMIEAFDYFGGLPKAALTDRMKSVFLDELDDQTPRWNPVFANFMATLGVAPRGGLAEKTSDERVNCILHSLRMMSVFCDICEHSSQG